MTAPSLNWSTPPSVVSYLTTELNTLASATNKIGAAIDPSSGAGAFVAPNARPAFMTVEAALASFTPGSGAYLLLWLLGQIDGTNYEDGGDSGDPGAGVPVWTRGIVTGTGAKRVIFPAFRIPPHPFKLLLGNRAGANLAASGNTLKYTVFTPQFPTV